MKKYFFIYKAQLMSAFQYIGNLLLSSIGYLLLIFILFCLWNHIYDDPSELINGYSKSQMVWYVIVTEILWKIYDGRNFSKEISNDVRGGNIAYNINKPYSYIGYVLSNHLGEGTVKAVIYVVIGLLVGIVFLGSTPSITIASSFFVILSSILAVVIDAFFVIAIGILAFYMEDSHPFYWIYSKFLLILGTIFPIEFFPGALQKIVMISPIYAVCYGPARLFVHFSYSEAVRIIIFQLVYVLIAYMICTRIYAKGVRKLNVNGG